MINKGKNSILPLEKTSPNIANEVPRNINQENGNSGFNLIRFIDGTLDKRNDFFKNLFDNWTENIPEGKWYYWLIWVICFILSLTHLAILCIFRLLIFALLIFGFAKIFGFDTFLIEVLMLFTG